MSGSFTPVETDGDATVVQGIIKEGAIQARNGDVNLNLHEYNGRACVLTVLADHGADIVGNAKQRITVTATGGTFALDVLDDTTAAIAFDAAAADLLAALEATDGIAPGDVAVTGAAGGPFLVEFTGTLAEQPIDPIVADGALLTGPGHAIAVDVVAEGGDSDDARNQAAADEITGRYS